MYTDRMTAFYFNAAFTGSRGRRADDLANSSRTEPLRTFPASRRPSMPTPRGGPRASMRAAGAQGRVHARDRGPRELGPGPPKATRRGGRRVAGLV